MHQLLKIYPNPFGDFISIESMLPLGNRPVLSLFDARGRAIKTILLQNTTQQISTTAFGNGLYFYQILTGDGQMIGNGKILRQ